MRTPRSMCSHAASIASARAGRSGRWCRVRRALVGAPGASLEHSSIQINLKTALKTRLRRGPCQPHGPELRVHTSETGVVFCGEPELADTIARPGAGPHKPEGRRGGEDGVRWPAYNSARASRPRTNLRG